MSKSVLGAVVGAVADYFTGGLGGFTSLGAGLGGSVDQQERSERYASENRAFQERMSSTAYQRSVHDMRSAGINPMVAYSQGGASSPAGSVATAIDTVGPGVSSALSLVRAVAEIENLQAQKLTIESQADLNEALAGKATEDIKVSGATAKKLSAELEKLNAELPRLRNLAGVENSKAGPIRAWIDKATETLRGITGTVLPWINQGGAK